MTTAQQVRAWLLQPPGRLEACLLVRWQRLCTSMLCLRLEARRFVRWQRLLASIPSLPPPPQARPDTDRHSTILRTLRRPGAAARSGDAGRGCLFAAHRGAGAYLAPLWEPAAALARIAVADCEDTSAARFMESFESRHSDHSFTARVVRGWRALGVV